MLYVCMSRQYIHVCVLYSSVIFRYMCIYFTVATSMYKSKVKVG